MFDPEAKFASFFLQSVKEDYTAYIFRSGEFFFFFFFLFALHCHGKVVWVSRSKPEICKCFRLWIFLCLKHLFSPLARFTWMTLLSSWKICVVRTTSNRPTLPPACLTIRRCSSKWRWWARVVSYIIYHINRDTLHVIFIELHQTDFTWLCLFDNQKADPYISMMWMQTQSKKTHTQIHI